MFAAARSFLVRLAPSAALVLWAFTGSATEPPRPESRAPEQRTAAAGDEGAPQRNPSPDASPAAAASPVEAAFSARAGVPLTLFGYDLFDAARNAPPPPAQGAVQDGQTLGVGDEVTLTVRGTTPLQSRHVVNGEGLLLLPDLPPVAAAGRSLADVRRELQAAYAARHSLAEVYLYLTDVRRIGVLALGAVTRPGRVETTAFAVALDALLAAGGVRKDGSLRNIKLIRNGRSHPIDLYQLLLRGDGGGATMQLRDGDRLLVPPLGATAALAGPVKRPGIYELPADRPATTLRELLDLAGGPLRPAAHRALRLGIAADGQERAENLPDDGGESRTLNDGDLIVLSPRHEDRAGLVYVDGRTLRPGPRALSDAPTVAGLIGPRDLPPDAWKPFAVVASPAADGGPPALTAIDLDAATSGRAARRLRDGDRVIVLGAAEVEYLTSAPVLKLLRGDDAPKPTAVETAACPALGVLAQALAADPRGPLADGPQARLAATLTGETKPCPDVFRRHPDLLTFALSHSVLKRGGAGRPGFFPYADRRDVQPGGVADLQGPQATLIGHVRHPGVRSLARAGSLRALLENGRAFEAGVYPLIGVVERFGERDGVRRLIAFSPAATAAGRSDVKLVDRDRVHVFSAARIRAMTNPSGAKAAGRADADDDPAEALLDGHAIEPPDAAVRAFLAERTVQVRGAVASPGAYPAAGRAGVGALIDAAGGLTPQADASAIEITRPDALPARRVVSLETAEKDALTVETGGAVRVNPRPTTTETGAVLVEGEVRRPGWYDVLRGEKLSSLLARAGGLTDEAYPAGTVFLRESARRAEKAALEEQARALERNVALLLQKGEQVRQEDVGLARQLATQLRGVDPPGRIVVEADPAVLIRRPEYDAPLEAGDRVTVPKRPPTVAVTGEVMAPGHYPFRSGKQAEDYLRDAGGLRGSADESRIFMVSPDGRAEPLAVSAWNHRIVAVRPGATLIVPADPRPYGGRDLVQSVADVLAKIALTAASISVISR